MLQFYELALYTGLRRGELAGLRWSDVDVPGKVLHVHTNRCRSHGAGEATARTCRRVRRRAEPGRADRWGLGPRALRAVRGQRLAQNAPHVAAGEAWEESGWV
ncbi:tyrosine-type recombinase/integrase [Microbacterium ulmi]|uniref:Tyrosine-type recombinase/integrase n=1 Tax=Microbacterium ulmi TaxID=179095 RepID=A0A7Y2M0J0_9MICO|nr:tyrosine-type recombinase/integrase [Microbacterium ulmi]